MKNSDMPAMAQPIAVNGEECVTALTHLENDERFTGFTKREMFAMHAMSNLNLANYQKPEHLAQDALAMADALLEELSK